MIEFYFHYDSTSHKGKLVANGIEYLVDRIVCDVSTETERKEVSPKFVVKGQADSIVLSEGVAYIS